MKPRQILLLTLMLLGGSLAREAQAFYNPSTGRWLSRDPIQEQGGQNLCEFAGNTPVQFVDALGQRPINVQFNAFIPGQLGSWLPEPFPGSPWYFHTDERSFGGGSSRIHATATIESLDIGKNAPSRGANRTGVAHKFWADPSRRRRLENGGWFYDPPATATVGGNAWVDQIKCESLLRFDGVHAAYGYYPTLSPDINFTVLFDFIIVGKDKVLVTISGWHDHFPNYEAIVESNVRYAFDTTGTGPNPINLNWPMYFFATPFVIDAETPGCCSQ